MTKHIPQLTAYLREVRHHLHRFPELSNQEFATTAYLREQLAREDIAILDLQLATGLVAEITGGKPGPLVVLRADIDALPIEEQSGVAFSSQNPGVMHACGHDFHASAALGAAIFLQRQRAELAGRVRILFQPAEENGNGAPAVLASGALQNASVIFGLHNDPGLPVGVVGSKAGALTAGVDRFAIRIKGTGTHAARPHEGNDPIIIAGQLIASLQTLIARNLPSDQNAVVSITQVHSGTTWNVIPEEAWLEGTVRTFNAASRDLLEKRLRQLLDGLAISFNASVTLDWQAGPPSVCNDERWAAFALEQASASGLEARTVEASPIGEDFAFYQQQVPGAFVMVGSGGPWPLHHPQFRVDDEALLPAALYLANLALAASTKLASAA
ncbi:amidohydrolase [Erwinia phyllosphaerae]|uniref:amidohydrolase n=1 Tax=Erwinia phyllosphaerae TaxID=2853256 RepID=UPI001FEF6D75|nr:amidohydrolase [Erwinia phyllosphaerae]MBV4366710.1 amidohydrolase [Erwinia phyllosphaerae]